MEQFMEMLSSGNWIAWVIVALVFFLVVKLLKSAGKGLMIFIMILVLSVILYQFFPGLVQPLVDFVNGSWMN